MDPDIEPMAGGGESLIGDDWCSLCTHKCSAHHAEIDALRARIAELEARLALAERVVRAASNVATEIEESTRGTTHWAYCEEFHPRCRWLLLLREAVAAYREETK